MLELLGHAHSTTPSAARPPLLENKEGRKSVHFPHFLKESRYDPPLHIFKEECPAGDRHGWRKLEQRRSSCRGGVVSGGSIYAAYPRLPKLLRGNNDRINLPCLIFRNVYSCEDVHHFQEEIIHA